MSFLKGISDYGELVGQKLSDAASREMARRHATKAASYLASAANKMIADTWVDDEVKPHVNWRVEGDDMHIVLSVLVAPRDANGYIKKVPLARAETFVDDLGLNLPMVGYELVSARYYPPRPQTGDYQSRHWVPRSIDVLVKPMEPMA